MRVVVQRWLFTAVAPGGKRFKIQDRLLYLSCGLCAGQPLTERLAPGAARKWTYVFDRQFYLRLVGQIPRWASC